MLLQVFLLLSQIVHFARKFPVFELKPLHYFQCVERVTFLGLLELFCQLSVPLICLFLGSAQLLNLTLMLDVLPQTLLELIFVVFH